MAFIPRNIRTTCYIRTEYRQNFDTVLERSFIKAVKVIKHNKDIKKMRMTFTSVINQFDTQNFCFTISLFHASTCFEHICSKHVEAWNKCIVKQKFCVSSWLITEINILRCTVSKTSKWEWHVGYPYNTKSNIQHFTDFWRAVVYDVKRDRSH